MKILFQGDSITDCGRYPEEYSYGYGYPNLVSAQLGFENPKKYDFVNKGISGNRIVDVYARIKRDIINLKPDFMSILIGVNDVWHEYVETPNGVANDKFYKVYCMLIDDLKEALPELKIMILEPFCLKGSGNENYFDDFKVEVLKRAEMAKKVAEKYNLIFVPLQEKFDEASKEAPNDYWLRDGVHPTHCGHELIKREWLKGFNSL